MPNAGMPQLDFSTFPTQLFWLAVTFITLYVLMRWLALPRVAAMIKTRRDQLDADLSRAEQLKAEAEGLLAAYQQTLASARAQAQAAVKETTDRVATEAAERHRQVNEALSRQITAAEREIAGAKQRAVVELHDIAIDIARSVTEKLTGGPADVTSVAAAVDRTMAEQARR
jgi:F-type H+-transporting ATPase subunit b